jgi:hypothetical protein
MADMIDAKDAKQILGCDDQALNGHINKGHIRAQRVGGKLMLNRDDVDRLAGANAEDEDGTIVLTGDSENLQIDLGKVVDDTAETIGQGRPSKPAAASNTDSITFGDELEVVNFDDGRTQDLDKTVPTVAAKGKGTGPITFTDSNTAIVTSVDETQVGVTTDLGVTDAAAPVRPQTGGPGESARRSVRSNRAARAEVEQASPVWLVLAILTLAIGLLVAVPYAVLAATVQPERDAAGNRRHGSLDHGWASFASTLVGFTVDPRPEQAVDGDFVAITDANPEAAGNAAWRHQEFLRGMTPADRVASFTIERVDGAQAISKKGDTYTIISTPRPGAPEGVTDDRVDLWGTAK